MLEGLSTKELPEHLQNIPEETKGELRKLREEWEREVDEKDNNPRFCCETFWKNKFPAKYEGLHFKTLEEFDEAIKEEENVLKKPVDEIFKDVKGQLEIPFE
jgi:hypothetical protein